MTKIKVLGETFPKLSFERAAIDGPGPLRRLELLYHITLHLARSKEHPEGSARFGYEITAPLDDNGMLDAAAWKEKRAQCRVRRFWSGESDRHGLLVHRPGGSGGATWTIDYDPGRTIDDEAGYHLNTHKFAMGEYVSIRDEDDKLHTFQVVAVRPIKSGQPEGH